jgi:hypothetical protein
MKKAALVLIFLCVSGSGRAADRLLLSVGASYLKHADANYRAIYGSGAVQPEFEFGVRIYRGLYVMGGYGAISRSGKIPDFGFDARSTQSFLSAGFGFVDRIGKILMFKLEAGLADVMYTEDALESSFFGSKLGYQADSGLLVTGKVFYSEVKVGYIFATETIGDVKFKLGGTRIGLLVGIRL